MSLEVSCESSPSTSPKRYNEEVPSDNFEPSSPPLPPTTEGNKVYPDLPNLTMQSNPLSPDSFSRSVSVDSGLHGACQNQSSEKSMNKPTRKLSSLQQEHKLNRLSRNLKNLKEIEIALNEQRKRTITSSSSSENDESYLSIDEVKSMLERALDTMNYSIGVDI